MRPSFLNDVEKIPIIYITGNETSPQEIFKFIESAAVNFLNEKR